MAQNTSQLSVIYNFDFIEEMVKPGAQRYEYDLPSDVKK